VVPPRSAASPLNPESPFASLHFSDEAEATQWLGHVQRLASTGLLVGGMAHDIAGLIQPLLGESERVLIKDDPREYRAALVKVREWARRSEEYVRALLDLVRRDERHRTAVSVESVVEDTLSLLESSKKMAGVSIRRNLDNHHEAYVDRTRLMQAVVNLVTNAVRASKEGGHEVDVTVRGWRKWVLVEVADNGPGVPAELEDRIFEPFVGARAATPARDPDGRLRSGTGLGLYITKRLIEEQGGRIEFETVRGKGSTFRLLLESAPAGVVQTPNEKNREGETPR
jgi:signal transduction histidine kinase